MGDDGTAVECTTSPEWLNDSFLTTVIRDVEKDDAAVVTSSFIAYAVNKGDNYLSQLLRVRVQYTAGDGTSRQRFLIIKTLPIGEFIRKMMVEGGTFRREIYTFNYTLPAMYQLVKEKTLKDAVPISCLGYNCPEPNALVLEDLQPLGYRMADRRAQLDLNHCKVALRTLARFHGMSVALYRKDPSYIEEYRESTYTESTRDVAKQVTYFSVKELSELTAHWAGYERFSEKLRHLSETCVDRMIELVEPREGKLCVLNHGDIWTNNILFKYSDTTGEVIDARLVDFQICRFASPALDIQFFFYTSPRKEVRINHWDEMLRVYHETLCDTLVSLGCEEDVISFQELEEEMEYCSLNGLIASCTLLVIVLAEPNTIDFAELSPDEVGKTNIMEKAQNGELFRKVFQDLLVGFEQKGLL